MNVNTPHDTENRLNASQSRKVLVVDDDLDIRETLVELLEDEGYMVDTAADGEAALGQLRDAAEPSVILLDLMMPRMDGFAFLQELRGDPRLAALPIVVLTAGRKIDQDALGVPCLLPKPVGADELLAALASQCTRA